MDAPGGFKLRQIQESPDRLTQPLIRTGKRGNGEFRKAGWDEGVAIATERIGDTAARFGTGSILRLGGSGSRRGALHDTNDLTVRFLNLLGGFTRTTGPYSSAA